MSVHVTLGLGAGGPVAIKTATGPASVDRLQHEAQRLHRAGHPGVVTVVGAGFVGEAFELRTRYVGDTLAHWTGSLAHAAGLGAAIATTVADLHEIGLVHGRLDATHVLVGADGRPRLCGLSHPGDCGPADDVHALGLLLEHLLARVGAERRSGLGWARSAGAGPRRALSQIAARALDPVATRRPSARALARSILAAVPGAELPPPATPTPVSDGAAGLGAWLARATGGPPVCGGLPSPAAETGVGGPLARGRSSPTGDVVVFRPGGPDRGAAGGGAGTAAADGHADARTASEAPDTAAADADADTRTASEAVDAGLTDDGAKVALAGADNEVGAGGARPGVASCDPAPSSPSDDPAAPAPRTAVAARRAHHVVVPNVGRDDVWAEIAMPPALASACAAGGMAPDAPPSAADPPADASVPADPGAVAGAPTAPGASPGADTPAPPPDPAPSSPAGQADTGRADHPERTGVQDRDDDADDLDQDEGTSRGGGRGSSTEDEGDAATAAGGAESSPPAGGPAAEPSLHQLHGLSWLDDGRGDLPPVTAPVRTLTRPSPLPRLGETRFRPGAAREVGGRRGRRRPVRRPGPGHQAGSASPEGRPGGTGPFTARRAQRRHARRATALRVGTACVVGLTLVAGGTLATRSGSGDDPPPTPAAAGPARPDGCRVPSVPAADVDGDGCPEPVRVEGRIVEAGGRRWSLGEPGDVAAVGDWDCDGSASPALLRPGTGDVFVFPRWASAGEPVTVDALDTVGGGTALRARRRPDGCDTLVVQRASGEVMVEVVR
ncbi:MAG TPA: hypothetical protein VIL48_18050 [Acidimicrobiales bacterium]